MDHAHFIAVHSQILAEGMKNIYVDTGKIKYDPQYLDTRPQFAITPDERARRNRRKKLAAKAKKRNR